MIQIGQATLEYTPAGCVTRYPDGTSFGAHPHHDDHHYTVIAARCGYSPDAPGRLQYAREHEACHHIVGEWIMGCRSHVIWSLAHGEPVDQGAAVLEESTVQAVQRWLRANERPIIGGCDWDGLKQRALATLEGVRE